jgi:hypothetical protein
MDTLSKLSHDSDADVAQGAILALGLIGAGTNNSRIALLLRQLSAYYSKEANQLFIVRIAQGLLHLGKGTLTLNPFHAHNLLVSHTAVAGLLVVLHASLDLKNRMLQSLALALALSLSLSLYRSLSYSNTISLLVSDTWTIPLPAIQSRHGHGATYAVDSRRKPRASACQCARRSSR